VIGAVLLAAGRSSRLGTAADSKLLLPWGSDDEPMVAVVAQTLCEAGFGQIVAVLGHRAEDVELALEPLPLTTVLNPDYAAGLSTSIAAGVSALPQAVGYLFALADMPSLRVATVRALCQAFEELDSAAIVVPVHGQRRGNPVLFGGHFRTELLGLEGDRGARRLLSVFADRVREVEVDDPGIHVDVDTEESYGRHRGRETGEQL
jgi:molybdenum cofactor cytidylyltransferase